MAIGDVIEDNLRNALELLELADSQAVLAKQQLGRVIGADFQVGAEISLIPSVFWVEGIRYRAMITPEQLTAIRNAAGGSTQGVTTVIEGMLNNELYTAAYMALQLLVSALANNPLPAFAIPRPGQPGEAIFSGGLKPIGACQFASGKCSDPYGATLCQSENGTVVDSCDGRPRVKQADGDDDAEDGL